MRFHRIGWTTLAVLAVLGIGSALFLAVPAQPTEGDLVPVGLSWEEIQAFNAGLADLVSGIYRLTGIAYAGFSLFALAVAVHGLRTRERWAWAASTLQPITHATFGIHFVVSGPRDLAILYLGLALVGALALFLARPSRTGVA